MTEPVVDKGCTGVIGDVQDDGTNDSNEHDVDHQYIGGHCEKYIAKSGDDY